MGKLELILWAADFILTGVGWLLGGGTAAVFCFLIGGILVFIALSIEDKSAPSGRRKWLRYGLATSVGLTVILGGVFFVRRAVAHSAHSSVTVTAKQEQPSRPIPVQSSPAPAVPEKQPKAAVPKGRATRKGSSEPSIQQDCGGGNCAISSGQQGGITAGKIEVDTDRILTDQSAPKLIAEIQDHPGTAVISAVGGGAEQVNLSQQLAGLLAHVPGWEKSGLGAADLLVGRPVHGIEVRPPKGQEDAGEALVRGLNAAGFVAYSAPNNGGGPRQHVLDVWIGSKD